MDAYLKSQLNMLWTDAQALRRRVESEGEASLTAWYELEDVAGWLKDMIDTAPEEVK